MHGAGLVLFTWRTSKERKSKKESHSLKGDAIASPPEETWTAVNSTRIW